MQGQMGISRHASRVNPVRGMTAANYLIELLGSSCFVVKRHLPLRCSHLDEEGGSFEMRDRSGPDVEDATLMPRSGFLSWPYFTSYRH